MLVCKIQNNPQNARSCDVTKFTERSPIIYFETLTKYQVFLISGTGRRKNGIYKDQILVQLRVVEPSVTGLAWRFSEIFLIIMCVIGKDVHILKDFSKHHQHREILDF